MLKAEDMVKLRFFCPKNRLKNVIEDLYSAKAIDIIQHEKDEELDIGTPIIGSSEISEALVKLRSIIYMLKIQGEAKNNTGLKYPKTKIREINNLHLEVTKITSEHKDVDNRLKFLYENEHKYKAIKRLGISPDILIDTKLLKNYIGYVNEPASIKGELKEELKDNYELKTVDYENRTLMCLFIEKAKENDALNIFRNHNFSEIKLSEEYIGKKEPLTLIQKEINSLVKKKKVIENKLKKIKIKNQSDLINTEKALSILSKKSESPMMFAETSNISIISGWVPKKNLDKLKKKLKKTTKNNIHIEDLEIGEDEAVPVKLNNPAFAKPSEFFLRLFSMPSYKEIDPTLFMFITFPLFFGLMLGDIGYGLVTMGLFLFLKKKIPDAKDLLNIMIIASISTIIFGGVFGEVFGFEIKEWLPGHEQEMHIETEATLHGEEIIGGVGHAAEEHHTVGFREWITTWPLHRNADNAINLIILTLIIGFIHVNFGLILGFLNIMKAHGLKHAILEKFSWVLVEAGLPIAILSLMGTLSDIFLYVGLGLLLLGAVMLFMGEGVQGLVELPSIFVHIGSYMRLMAIGLASVGLAVVVNEQTGPLFSKGIVGIIGAILIFSIGHIINIALGIIGPFLHSIRLHYVEHFTKFYKGGGKEFSPFGADDD